MKQFRSAILTAEVVGVLAVAFLFSATPSQAKECSAERPANARTYWSYRLIDGRKCWYEGRPMISKSLLHWPASRTAQAGPRPEAVVPAQRYKAMDAQASISDDPELKSKPQAKPGPADAGPVPSPKGTLTPEDLRAWGNTMAAMTVDPILAILDRWPDAELPQHQNKPAAAAAQTSAMNGRTILMVIIIFMALSAVLMTTLRKAGGVRRAGRSPLLAINSRWQGLEFTPDQLPKESLLLMDTRLEMPLLFSSDPIPMSLESRAGNPA